MSVHVAAVTLTLRESALTDAARPGAQALVLRIGRRTLPVAQQYVARAQFRRAPQTPPAFLTHPRGRLAASGKVVQVTDARGPAVDVRFGGPQAPYAEYHHQGTRPHVIAPKAGGALRFYSARSRGLVYVRSPKVVHHPGTRANPYLTDAVDRAVAQDGYLKDVRRVERRPGLGRP